MVGKQSFSDGIGKLFARLRWPLSLTTRMILLVVIAVTPALGIQAYNEYDLRRAHEADIRNKTIQITKQFGAEMGELREGAHQLLVALSRLPAVRLMDPGACPAMLQSLDESFPNYNLLGVADAAGNVRCSSRNTSLTSVAEQPFFKRAMTQNGLSVGNYWVDPVTGDKQIHFGLHFSNDAQGPIAGVAFASLDLKWLSDHLKERGLTASQSILIADREGNIISRLPNPEKLVGKNMRQGHAEIMDGDTTGWEEAKGVDGAVRIFGYVPPALPPYDLFLSAGNPRPRRSPRSTAHRSGELPSSCSGLYWRPTRRGRGDAGLFDARSRTCCRSAVSGVTETMRRASSLTARVRKLDS